MDVHAAEGYETCRINDMPWFLLNWKEQYYSDWRYLRFVCRMWAAIIDPRLTPAHTVGNCAQFHAGRNIRTLHVKASVTRNDTRYPVLPYDQPFTHKLSYISTITIRDTDYVVDLLMKHARYLPNVRSLCFLTEVTTFNDTLWSLIEEGFPNLVALMIRFPINNPWRFHNVHIVNPQTFFLPTLTLNKLETFVMNSFSYISFNFPSLKHFAFLGPLPIQSAAHDLYKSFLNSHSSHLESLVVPSSPPEFLQGEEIWKCFPKLRLLGAPITYIPLKTPPVHHPLQHLYVYTWDVELCTKGSGTYDEAIKEMTQRIPNLRCLTLDSTVRLSNKEIKSIRTICRRANIVYRAVYS
jgi:hypothetical protein